MLEELEELEELESLESLSAKRLGSLSAKELFLDNNINN
jgi:hypothetical protein